MRAIRPIQLAAILIAAAVVTDVSISKSAPNDKSDDIYPVIYSVADLPVYRLVDDRPAFDPSALIALIERSVVPDSWDEASISELKDHPIKRSLVICQTHENHEQLAELLASLRERSSRPRAARRPDCQPAAILACSAWRQMPRKINLLRPGPRDLNRPAHQLR